MRYKAEREAKRIARVERVKKAGRENDVAFLETLGSMERYFWHEARKEIDPNHINPYNTETITENEAAE